MSNGGDLKNYNESDYEPKVGSVVELPSGAFVNLLPSDWERASFRVPVFGDGPIKSLAVNIKIAGRTAQIRSGHRGLWVRVNVIYVGDCEPDQASKGWLKFN